MKKIFFFSKLSFLFLFVFSFQACNPIENILPINTVSNAKAVGNYKQSNIITTSQSIKYDGGTVQLNANNTISIQFKLSVQGQFPIFYDFTGTYTKSGNNVVFTVNYNGSLPVPNPNLTINGKLYLISTSIPKKVKLTFTTTLPFLNGNEIFIFIK
jgi:hypothetical protein